MTDLPAASPLDDARRLASELPEGDRAAAAALAARVNQSGRLGAMAAWLRRWRRQPVIARPHMVLFAGTHGVARRGVSVLGPQAAAEAVGLLGAGQSPVSRMCAATDIGLRVFDLALEHPTGDISETEALDPRGCAATLAFGMEAVAGGPDLLVLGALPSAGADVSLAALHALLSKGDDILPPAPQNAPEHVKLRAREALHRTTALHRPHAGDPLEALAAVGGRETAALVGALLAARAEMVPVLLDGSAALAAASVAARLAPDALAHCLLVQAPSDEAGIGIAAQLSLEPLFPAGFAGEGEAGAAAIAVLRAAAVLGG